MERISVLYNLKAYSHTCNQMLLKMQELIEDGTMEVLSDLRLPSEEFHQLCLNYEQENPLFFQY